MLLRTPTPDEAAALTELCLRSKAVWGYDDDFMQACRRELALAPADLRSPYVQVAEADCRVVGVVEVTPRGDEADLARLFVEPTDLRTGVGRLLFKWAKGAACDAGARTLVIGADPNAVGFYRRMGAVENGTMPSGSVPGRLLPRLIYQLC